MRHRFKFREIFVKPGHFSKYWAAYVAIGFLLLLLLPIVVTEIRTRLVGRKHIEALNARYEMENRKALLRFETQSTSAIQCVTGSIEVTHQR